MPVTLEPLYQTSNSAFASSMLLRVHADAVQVVEDDRDAGACRRTAGRAVQEVVADRPCAPLKGAARSTVGNSTGGAGSGGQRGREVAADASVRGGSSGNKAKPVTLKPASRNPVAGEIEKAGEAAELDDALAAQGDQDTGVADRQVEGAVGLAGPPRARRR